MAFSQRARAYTLNPTLPCPTLPLSPRALSDSSKSQQRAGFALNYRVRTMRSRAWAFRATERQFRALHAKMPLPTHAPRAPRARII